MKSKLRTAASLLALAVAGVLSTTGVANAAPIATYDLKVTSQVIPAMGNGGMFQGNITAVVSGSLYDFQPTDSDPGALPETFYAWCLQEGEFFNYDTTLTYDLVQVSEAPVLLPSTTTADPMGAYNANAMRLLFGTLNPDFDGPILASKDPSGSFDDLERRNAFQLAIWEIASERSGTFSVTGPGSYTRGGTLDENILANYWLGQIQGSLAGNVSGWNPDYELFALINMEKQDFVVRIPEGGPPSEVPLPAAAWLFGSALLGMAAIARRRKTAVAA